MQNRWLVVVVAVCATLFWGCEPDGTETGTGGNGAQSGGVSTGSGGSSTSGGVPAVCWHPVRWYDDAECWNTLSRWNTGDYGRQPDY